MPNVLVSVRLSPELAGMVDRAVQDLECSPSALVEVLLERSETQREEILQWVPQGPFTEKRNLRLAPGAVNRLAQLAGEAVDSSKFIRQLLAYFFSIPAWAQRFGGNGNGIARARPGTASSSKSGARISPRHLTAEAHGHPLAAFVVLLALLLPLLILAVEALVGWLRRHRGSGPSAAPEDGSGEPPPPSPA